MTNPILYDTATPGIARTGLLGAMQTSFALHHLAHAHNMLVHGKLVDPTGLMPAIKKHEKAAG